MGAEPRTLLRLVLADGVATAAAGVAVGAMGSMAVTKGLGSLLFEVRPQDPATVVITAAGLLAVSVAASYLPARRALARNPADVLRCE